jgi:hypothetical protein
MIMDDWITGKELIKIWGIQENELLDYVLMGLQPYYKELYEPKPPPETAERIKTLSAERKEIEKQLDELQNPVTIYDDTSLYRDPITGNLICEEITFVPAEKFGIADEENRIESIETEIEELTKKSSWRQYEKPLDPQVRIKVIQDLVEAVYNLAELKAFESERKIQRISGKIDEENSNIKLRPEDMGDYVFWQENADIWFIKFKDSSSLVKHTIGMKYIAKILEKAPEPFDPIEEEYAKNYMPTSQISNDDLKLESALIATDSLSVKKSNKINISNQEMIRAKEALETWQQEIEDMDEGEEKDEKLKNLEEYKKNFKKHELVKFGHNKNAEIFYKKVGSPEEDKIKDKYRKAIINAIKEIDKADNLKELVTHFKDNNQLSYKRSEFKYRNELIKWKVNYIN